jgi:hypothetical protein
VVSMWLKEVSCADSNVSDCQGRIQFPKTNNGLKPVESKPSFGYNARPVYPATAEYAGIHTLVHVGVSLEPYGGSGWRVEDLTLNDWRITWQ